MDIHEYQAKEILRRHNVSVPDGFMSPSIEGVVASVKKLQEMGHDVFAIKAQIHAGGRGKAGGVKVVRNIADAEEFATQLLGTKLVTHQTGPHGQEVRCLYVEAGSKIKKEYYLSLVLDRDNSCISVIASGEGGMDIEQIARQSPEKIFKVAIDPMIGINPFYGRQLARSLDLNASQVGGFYKLLVNLYEAFMHTDAMQLEINPLVATIDGEFVCLDGKFSFDDNALYRHADLLAMRDVSEENALEIEAAKHGLSYIKMDGEIGCMVNGAGLAMATMDIIKLHGKEPANFLDVGGGASKEKVAAAFRIILSDTNVRAVLVNIFGGIMRCDIIAEGIIEALQETKLDVPLVVRLAGTSVELGKEMLSKSGLDIVSASDLADAAARVVRAIAS